ncbi:MAG TPA: late competence development ComFB family protein [Desulfosporosinus sp.]|nr:late competence development ComFB family protein [Desulfosporosinus sp.]
MFFGQLTFIIKTIKKSKGSEVFIMFELINHTETSVRQALQDFLRDNEISCSCEQCQADIMALALNRLPAHYYVSKRGEILTQWESQSTTDKARIMADVVRAAQQVSASPSHQLK